MPMITPNLIFITNEKIYASIEKALADAATRAFETGKTTSVLVFVKGLRPPSTAPGAENPVSVIYVKVTEHPW